jgi:hypothetical protein
MVDDAPSELLSTRHQMFRCFPMRTSRECDASARPVPLIDLHSRGKGLKIDVGTRRGLVRGRYARYINRSVRRFA